MTETEIAIYYVMYGVNIVIICAFIFKQLY